MKVDKLDMLILHELQENARIPNVDLAQKVGEFVKPLVAAVKSV